MTAHHKLRIPPLTPSQRAEDRLFAKMMSDARRIRDRAASDRRRDTDALAACRARILGVMSGQWQPTAAIARRIGAAHANVLVTLYALEARGQVESRKRRGSKAKFWRLAEGETCKASS